ncbi:hypothetical protein QFC20_007226 [Naganishia adeliensis]|uniref:Uncharacterized protein n=1 Tax=Naganishia adeliensis TaxID=92952 RepID=A0ACC2V1L9_9TREE|nr:hypothetical protein QFC20_007226 [Naganishia adeliensis]
MAEKKVQKALTIVGIILLVFIVIFASAVTALFLRARRRRANHRATVLHQLPLTSQTPRRSMITSSRGNQQAARKKSIRERERMNLAFGVVEDDVPNEPSMPYNSTLPMPATSSTMSNPYDAVMKGSRDPFQDPALLQMADRTRNKRAGKEVGGWTYRSEHRGRRKETLTTHSATPSPQRPSPAKASPSPVRTAKAKYQSTSSPIKPQRALPTSFKEPIGAIHPYRIPATSRAPAQTLAAAAKSGMKRSTSDRSLNAGYF